MYIVDALKKEVKLDKKSRIALEQYDAYLRRHFAPEDTLNAIYDSCKPSYQFFKAAWESHTKGQLAEYRRHMCAYSQALNNDADFLKYFINTMFTNTKNLDDFSVDQLKELIQKKYAEWEAL